MKQYLQSGQPLTTVIGKYTQGFVFNSVYILHGCNKLINALRALDTHPWMQQAH